MEPARNAFKHAIAAGKLQIGLWCNLCSNIAADIVRVEDGRLAEHWDVLQDEATQAESPRWGNGPGPAILN